MIAAFGVKNPWVMFVAATPLVLLIALISWFSIEKPCLKLKSWKRDDYDPGLAPKTNPGAPIAPVVRLVG